LVPLWIKKKSVQKLCQQSGIQPLQGAYTHQGKLFVHANQKEFSMTISEMTIKGRHNQYNSMAAAIVAHIFELDNDFIRESFKNFKNLEHRLEHVLSIHGIDFINDSKATNVNSTWYALETMEQPVVWIAGGIDKGNDYSVLAPLVKEKAKAIVCLGMDNRNIHDAFAKHVDIIMNTQNANEAVKAAYHLAKEGDAVLLSPACASFDLFENYEDRGRQFKEAIRQL
jgi:UDP-N-acetylmuramoylalanine--D-glutamate ligase